MCLLAVRSQLLEYNPCEGLSAKGGKPGKKINALTDEQVKLLLDTVRGLPPYRNMWLLTEMEILFHLRSFSGYGNM